MTFRDRINDLTGHKWLRLDGPSAPDAESSGSSSQETPKTRQPFFGLSLFTAKGKKPQTLPPTQRLGPDVTDPGLIRDAFLSCPLGPARRPFLVSLKETQEEALAAELARIAVTVSAMTPLPWRKENLEAWCELQAQRLKNPLKAEEAHGALLHMRLRLVFESQTENAVDAKKLLATMDKAFPDRVPKNAKLPDRVYLMAVQHRHDGLRLAPTEKLEDMAKLTGYRAEDLALLHDEQISPEASRAVSRAVLCEPGADPWQSLQKAFNTFPHIEVPADYPVEKFGILLAGLLCVQQRHDEHWRSLALTLPRDYFKSQKGVQVPLLDVVRNLQRNTPDTFELALSVDLGKLGEDAPKLIDMTSRLGTHPKLKKLAVQAEPVLDSPWPIDAAAPADNAELPRAVLLSDGLSQAIAETLGHPDSGVEDVEVNTGATVQGQELILSAGARREKAHVTRMDLQGNAAIRPATLEQALTNENNQLEALGVKLGNLTKEEAGQLTLILTHPHCRLRELGINGEEVDNAEFMGQGLAWAFRSPECPVKELTLRNFTKGSSVFALAEQLAPALGDWASSLRSLKFVDSHLERDSAPLILLLDAARKPDCQLEELHLGNVYISNPTILGLLDDVRETHPEMDVRHK